MSPNGELVVLFAALVAAGAIGGVIAAVLHKCAS